MAKRNFKYQAICVPGAAGFLTAWQIVNTRAQDKIERTFDSDDEGANKSAAMDWIQTAIADEAHPNF